LSERLKPTLKLERALGTGGDSLVKKLRYPRNSDIAEAIVRALSENPLMHPSELYDEVLERLRAKKFYVGLVTPKRVWRVYEEMVRRGEIYDVLDVVRGGAQPSPEG